MDQLLNFVTGHPYLVGAFVVLFALFVRNEMSRGGSTISPAQLVHLVNNEGGIVVDVRDKAEFEQGHIVDAINIPHADGLSQPIGLVHPYGLSCMHFRRAQKELYTPM